VVETSKDVADAHPNGTAPWNWNDYVNKFKGLTDGIITPRERDRFVAKVKILDNLPVKAVRDLNPVLSQHLLTKNAPTGQGIFDWPEVS